MKYSKEEALAEVRKREEKLREKRFRRQMPLLSGAGLAFAAALTVVLFSFHNESQGGVTAGMDYGTMLLNDGIGVYVLIAAAAFMAGVVITVLCLRYRRRHQIKYKRE